MKKRATDIEGSRRELPGELPVEDISADGGGQLTSVGPPYDGTGGVVRGMEREIQEDRRGAFRTAARQLGSLFRGRSGAKD